MSQQEEQPKAKEPSVDDRPPADPALGDPEVRDSIESVSKILHGVAGAASLLKELGSLSAML